ncbi:EF-hand domain-containing protein [Plasmodiophora brassicae]|uniref:EF-hand domain-containing protein n=1 Tax=Plasmodiophora brassicae TaxID=37360 RepID=A0A0G4J003_PLABS|nr:hypothetical protein PBRA_008275 [Plasmodiophora brassicae]SPR00938.1 unnamed protein product [Plasmodiophora brassicae]
MDTVGGERTYPVRSISEAKMAAVDVQEVLLRMRIELSKRGTACMLFVKEALHDRDPTGEGYLSYAEFEQVLARVGIFLPLPQLAVLCRRYDTNANRSVCIAVIVDDLVADLNDARRGIVDDLFSGLSQGAESIATATLLSSFFAGQHPKVAAGDWPASKVSDDFADLVRAFSSSGTTISRAEFVHLFRFISASMPLDDRRFVETVQATFTRPGANLDAEGEPPVNAVYLESVGHVLKEKVRQKTRGQESEANTLTRVFHHFDLEDSGTVTWDEWQRALERFGIIMPEKESYALFEEHDRHHEGRIHYADFVDRLYSQH